MTAKVTTTEQLRTVTPAQARAWLATADTVPAGPQVDLLAAAMAAGQYQPNPLDPVRIDLNGRLRGGTRRLAALCQLGQPMPLWVDLCPPVQPHELQPARFVMNKRLTGGGPGLRAQAMRYDGTNAQAVHAFVTATATQDTAQVQSHVRDDAALMLRLIDHAGRHWDYHVAYPGDWVIYLQWADDTMLNLPHTLFVQLFDHEERITTINTTNTINYVSGDATDPQGDGPKVIAHVCNNIGAWGAGFVLAVSARWPQPEQEYLAAYGKLAAARARQTPAAGHPLLAPFGAERGERLDRDSLGTVQFVPVRDGLTVANMIAQDGVGRDGQGTPPIRYDSVGACLYKVARFCLDAEGGPVSVHMPRIGCGLAGGDWDVIEKIIELELVNHGVAVTVYDFDPYA